MSDCESDKVVLVSCLRSSFAESLHLVEDGISGRGPDEGFALLIVMNEVAVDCGFERTDTVEGAASNTSGGDLREEPLDLIQPAGTGRGEMHVIPGMADKPPRHLRGFVRPIVVHDHVHLALRRHGRVDLIEELKQLLMAMPPMTAADHLAGRDIQRGKQRGGAMPNVVMGLSGGNAGPH